MNTTWRWCGARLAWAQRGWTHAEGGLYMMRCASCGWQGAPCPSPARFPRCGSRNLRDDHCALPVMTGVRRHETIT
jgi:hypothetical protein